MDTRKKKLFNIILKEHIKSGKPIGSTLLVDKSGLKLSPATVRHEMMKLEKEGYIFHPYTSAGRIPTEKGYRFYINNFLQEKRLTLREKKILREIIHKRSKRDYRDLIKSLAKALALLSRQTIIVGFSPRDVYYTGISNILCQPEFSQLDLVYDMSKIIDHLDEVMSHVFNEMDNQIKILLGKKNPFDNRCGVIIGKYKLNHGPGGMLGILGPMRMPYDKNLALLRYSRELLGRV